MENSNNILILKDKVKRLSDDQIFTCIIPDPELGYFNSLIALQKDGYNIESLIDLELVKLNPTRFKIIN